MATVSGLFDTYMHAREAVHALEAAGFRSADVSLVANHREDITPDEDVVAEEMTTGAEVGAMLGGAGGLLAGLGLIAIPGIGPVLAGGWLMGMVAGAAAGAGLGAATGGLVGLLTEAGVPKSDAHVYAEGLRRGGAFVSVRVADEDEATARRIFDERGAIDVPVRRAQYEAEGWGPDSVEAARIEAEIEAEKEAVRLGNRPPPI